MYMENNSKQHVAFTDEEFANIVEYGEVLRDIHRRLVREGYFLDPKRRIWNIFKVATPGPGIVLED